MTALDYARDEETAARIYDFSRAHLLPDEAMHHRVESLRRARRAAGSADPRQGGPHEAAGAAPEFGRGEHELRARSGGAVALEDALVLLAAPPEWLEPLRKSGAYYAQIRALWRGLVLSSHPDKQPLGQATEARRAKADLFTAAVAAFEAVEACCAAGGFLDAVDGMT